MKTQHSQKKICFLILKKGWYTVEMVWGGCFPLCLLGPFHNQLSQLSLLCWCSWFYLVGVFVTHLHIFAYINLYSCLTYFSCQRSPFLPGQGLIYDYFLRECQISQVEVKWNHPPGLRHASHLFHSHRHLIGQILWKQRSQQHAHFQQRRFGQVCHRRLSLCLRVQTTVWRQLGR